MFLDRRNALEGSGTKRKTPEQAERVQEMLENWSGPEDAPLLFNLRTGYNINEKLRIELDVLNLFDSTDDDITYFYESRISSSEPATGVPDRHFHPIEPRSLRAAVTYRF